MLKSAEARGIARALWGDVNSTYRTNTRGAFYYSCAGHGGFIVSENVIPEVKREWVQKYVHKENATRYISRSGKSVLMHGYRTRGARMTYVKTEEVKFYIFEEDVAWCIAVMLGINLTKHPMKEGDARLAFWNWYDEKNPVVARRKEVDQMRKDQDPDLIISASRLEDGKTSVLTADYKRHVVCGYDKANDEYGNPFLSNCEIVEKEVEYS